MNQTVIPKGWTLCDSQRFPGKKYYFNRLGKISVWSLEDIYNLKSCLLETNDQFADNNYPEPTSPQKEFQSPKQCFDTFKLTNQKSNTHLYQENNVRQAYRYFAEPTTSPEYQSNLETSDEVELTIKNNKQNIVFYKRENSKKKPYIYYPEPTTPPDDYQSALESSEIVELTTEKVDQNTELFRKENNKNYTIKNCHVPTTPPEEYLSALESSDTFQMYAPLKRKESANMIQLTGQQLRKQNNLPAINENNQVNKYYPMCTSPQYHTPKMMQKTTDMNRVTTSQIKHNVTLYSRDNIQNHAASNCTESSRTQQNKVKFAPFRKESCQDLSDLFQLKSQQIREQNNLNIAANSQANRHYLKMNIECQTDYLKTTDKNVLTTPQMKQNCAPFGKENSQNHAGRYYSELSIPPKENENFQQNTQADILATPQTKQKYAHLKTNATKPSFGMNSATFQKYLPVYAASSNVSIIGDQKSTNFWDQGQISVFPSSFQWPTPKVIKQEEFDANSDLDHVITDLQRLTISSSIQKNLKRPSNHFAQKDENLNKLLIIDPTPTKHIENLDNRFQSYKNIAYKSNSIPSDDISQCSDNMEKTQSDTRTQRMATKDIDGINMLKQLRIPVKPPSVCSKEMETKTTSSVIKADNNSTSRIDTKQQINIKVTILPESLAEEEIIKLSNVKEDEADSVSDSKSIQKEMILTKTSNVKIGNSLKAECQTADKGLSDQNSAVLEKNLPNGDLRLYLARKKKILTNRNDESTNNEVKSLREGITKKVTFNLNHDPGAQCNGEIASNTTLHVLEVEKNSCTNGGTSRILLRASELRKLAKRNVIIDKWYLAVDYQTLIDGYKVIVEIVLADQTCFLLIPPCVWGKLETESKGNKRRGRDQTSYASKVRRFLEIVEDRIMGPIRNGTTQVRRNLDDHREIIRSCLTVVNRNYHVVLISNNRELGKTAKVVSLPCLTLQDIIKITEVDQQLKTEDYTKIADEVHVTLFEDKNDDLMKAISKDNPTSNMSISKERNNEVTRIFDKNTLGETNKNDIAPKNITIEVNTSYINKNQDIANRVLRSVEAFNTKNIEMVPKASPFKFLAVTESQQQHNKANLNQNILFDDKQQIKDKVFGTRSKIASQPAENTENDSITDNSFQVDFRGERSYFSSSQYKDERNNIKPANVFRFDCIEEGINSVSDNSSQCDLKIRSTNSESNSTLHIDNSGERIYCGTKEGSQNKKINKNTPMNNKIEFQDRLNKIFSECFIANDVFEVRKDEIICCFVQIMEDILVRAFTVLKNPAVFECRPAPWSLPDALEAVSLSCRDDGPVRRAADNLSHLLREVSGDTGVITKEIAADDFNKIYGCGLLLVESLLQHIGSTDELVHARLGLLALSAATPEEALDMPATPKRLAQSDPLSEKRGYVKGPAEVLEYLRGHYPAWADALPSAVTADNGTNLAIDRSQTPTIKILRTFGRDLDKVMLVYQKDDLMTNRDDQESNMNCYITGNTFDQNNNSEERETVQTQFVRKLSFSGNEERLFKNNAKLIALRKSQNQYDWDGHTVEKCNEFTLRSKANQMTKEENRIVETGYQYDENKNVNTYGNITVCYCKSTDAKCSYVNNFSPTPNASKMDIKCCNSTTENSDTYNYNSSTINGNSMTKDPQNDAEDNLDDMPNVEATIDLLFSETKEVVIGVKEFCEMAARELRRSNVNPSTKQRLHKRALHVRDDLQEIIDVFIRIIHRETDEPGHRLQDVMMKAGITSNNARICQYRQVITKCVEKFRTLQRTLDTILRTSADVTTPSRGN